LSGVADLGPDLGHGTTGPQDLHLDLKGTVGDLGGEGGVKGARSLLVVSEFFFHRPHGDRRHDPALGQRSKVPGLAQIGGVTPGRDPLDARRVKEWVAHRSTLAKVEETRQSAGRNTTKYRARRRASYSTPRMMVLAAVNHPLVPFTHASSAPGT
jgi:hypothetical protein